MNLAFKFENIRGENPTHVIHAVVSGKPSDDDTDLVSRVTALLRSETVEAVCRTMGTIDQRLYLSDQYGIEPLKGSVKPAVEPYASKHKTSGLFFVADAPRGGKTAHLLPGITGARDFLEKVRDQERWQVEIDLVWWRRRRGRIRIAKGFEEIHVGGTKIGGESRPVVTFYYPDWGCEDGKETMNRLGSLFGFEAGR